jgi:5-methyltetrahydropteroyltriglutamate--homocysteine methyltransferase
MLSADFSMARAGTAAGLGRSSLHSVPTTGRGVMDTKALAARIARDRSEGFTPFAVAATSCTTGTGALDPLPEIADLAAAGCTYVQIDEVAVAILCDPAAREKVKAQGGNADRLVDLYIDAINQAVKSRPPGMTVGVHVCRGNFRSTWISEGGYEPVAEVLFGTVNVDAFFLEYDNDRSGDFAPLRFIRPGKQQVVLGLITTKNGELENPEGVKARLEEAAKYVAKEQICLSPQCGFASTEEGNSLSETQQWDKVRLVTQIASEVW